MSKLNIKIKERVAAGQKSWEGTVDITGLKTTKLVRKDGSSVFTNKSALTAVARGLGKRLGMEVAYAETLKKAAKKSVKVAKPSSCCCTSTCQPTTAPMSTTPATTTN